MSIFHPRVIEKRLNKVAPVPPEHLRILESWSANLAEGTYDSETQNDGEFIQRILIDVLGYKGSSGVGSWSVAKNQPVGTGNVDVALGSFNSGVEPQIIAPFELKGAKTKDLDIVMSGRNKTPVQQAWEYAMDARGAQWVLVSNYAEIRLYAVGYGRKEYESFDLSNMVIPENYHRFILLLSSENLLGGQTLALLEESDQVQKEISKDLYAEYSETRIKLIAEILDRKHIKDVSEAVTVAQKLLDRTLFIAFAEDTGLLKKDTLKETYETSNPYNPQPIWDNFRGLFRAVDRGNQQLNIPQYNGGLFATDSKIEALGLSDEACKRLSQFGSYDYQTDVSVNILGHVFEQSISDLEDLKKTLASDFSDRAKTDSKRHTDAIFYTPPFVTRMIVENSVGQWLLERKQEIGINDLDELTDEDFASIRVIERGKKKGQVVYNSNVKKHITLWEKYKECLSNIKVVDPACGSGAFLNEVFDYLFREGNTINRTLESLHGGQISLFRWDTHILANNIFGVDINRESVEITKLSLWLKTANRNEKLSYLDNNIKVGNSLISDASVSGDLAFDWAKQFAGSVEAGKFDVVVGNPPYIDSEMMTKFWPKEREWISANFEQTKGNWDIYVAFFELGLNLLCQGGYLSYISPDKWISKDFGIALRNRILPNLRSINAVGRSVFEDALVDSIITTAGQTETDELLVAQIEKSEPVEPMSVAKADIEEGKGFDPLFSPNYQLLRQLEKATSQRFGDIIGSENACATSDTYTLKEFLTDASSEHDFDPEQEYKVANTGTLDRYVFRWGVQPMRYLKDDYLRPKVSKSDFQKNLGNTYNRRAKSPKIIVKGLTLLDGALDLDGAFVPGKSTTVICSEDHDTLKFLAGILNSHFASFYVKQKYASSSYNGGVNFTTDMIDSIPIPEKIDRAFIVAKVEEKLEAEQARISKTAELFRLIRLSGGPMKLSKKLANWQVLSGKEFIGELERMGLTLSVTEKGEWTDLLEKAKASIKSLSESSRMADQALNESILDSFGIEKLI